MSHYLVLLILEFLPARLALLPYGLDSNVTQLLANMLTKPSVFYYLPIVPCNLVSIKLLLLLLLSLLLRYMFCTTPLTRGIAAAACIGYGALWLPFLVLNFVMII